MNTSTGQGRFNIRQRCGEVILVQVPKTTFREASNKAGLYLVEYHKRIGVPMFGRLGVEYIDANMYMGHPRDVRQFCEYSGECHVLVFGHDGYVDHKMGGLSDFPAKWLIHADNAFVFTQKEARAVKDRWDLYRDLRW